MKIIAKISKPSGKTWMVKGADLDEVFKNLNKHKWWGLYQSNGISKWPIKDGKVETVLITAKPVITMPKWAGLSKASKEEKKSWEVMIKALQKHEMEHHTVFLKCVEAWKKKMEAGENIDDKKMTAAWNALRVTSQKAQDSHDKKTDHGAKKGVILNVPPKKK